MARGRIISKSWSTSKKRSALYREAAPLAEFCLQLFPLLVVHSDDYGRLDADPETVKLLCDPSSPRSFSEFAKALAIMEHVGLIRRYTVAGAQWMQIERFDEHQPGFLSKRTTPRSPAPPPLTELPGNSGPIELNLIELNRKERKAKSPEPSQPPFLVFPAIGPVREFPLSETQVVEWAALYPVIDVRAECRKALAWVKANPGRQKTAKGMPRFLNSWIARAVDSGRGSQAIPPAAARTQREEWVCPHEPKCLGRGACHILERIRLGKKQAHA